MKIQKNIRLEGIVEGIGMRPTLFRYSVARGLTGYVRNSGGGVDLLWQGEAEAVEAAAAGLKDALPAACRLLTMRVRTGAAAPVHTDFAIVSEAENRYSVNLAAPPDRVPCAACLREIADPADRRFRHAFNACAACGPRSTVMQALPYDRRNTSWHAFPLCPECRAEYEDVRNRRFHIEGISCPKCGPLLRLLPGGATGGDALDAAADVVRRGGILALQGVGGFQLICDAANRDAVQLLRERKHRPHQPFALMAASVAAAERYFLLSPAERELFTSPAGPGVLLRWKSPAVPFPCAAIAPDGDAEAVVMAPSSPLHRLLLDAAGAELLVATSGNRSGEPPALDADTARRQLDGTADALLVHNRAIRWRNDDSIAAVNCGRPQLWRRARGYSGVFPHRFRSRVLALGAELKNTFAITVPDRLFLSPHWGNLGNADAFRAWQDAVRRAVDGFPERPETVACDLHPDYPSSRFGAELARRWDVPLARVPHHAAHALAALLETGSEEALVFVFDGTGLGADGVLRGAELFELNRDGGRRLAVWRPVPLPGGEAAVRRPYRQLGARLFLAGVSGDEAKKRYPAFAEDLDAAYRLCERNWNAPQSGAAGRFFDAASALLGIAPGEITYEGQAAIRLEQAARRETAPAAGPAPEYASFAEADGRFTVDWTPLFRLERAALSACRIHLAVADAVVRSAEYALTRRDGRRKTPPVLLTGGVFQNRLLAELVIGRLRAKRIAGTLAGVIPPGDGGVSCGQALWADEKFHMDGPDRFVREAV